MHSCWMYVLFSPLNPTCVCGGCFFAWLSQNQALTDPVLGVRGRKKSAGSSHLVRPGFKYCLCSAQRSLRLNYVTPWVSVFSLVGILRNDWKEEIPFSPSPSPHPSFLLSPPLLLTSLHSLFGRRKLLRVDTIERKWRRMPQKWSSPQ